jgi:hypothetical protein
MMSRTIRLDLSRQQVLIFYAHLFVYLDCQDHFRDGPWIETVKDLGSRLFALHCQGEARAMLTLTLQEARAIRLVLRALIQCYGENPPSVHREKALRDLMMCQALLQRAKRHPMRSQREESHA